MKAVASSACQDRISCQEIYGACITFTQVLFICCGFWDGVPYSCVHADHLCNGRPVGVSITQTISLDASFVTAAAQLGRLPRLSLPT